VDSWEQYQRLLADVKVLPREIPSLYGSFPVALHRELEGFVPATDLEKARARPAQEYAAAAPRSKVFSLKQWRWALSVRIPPLKYFDAFARCRGHAVALHKELNGLYPLRTLTRSRITSMRTSCCSTLEYGIVLTALEMGLVGKKRAS